MKNKAINWLEQICEAIKSLSLATSQNDWTETNPESPAYIRHKPTIPDAQIQSDWEQDDDTKKDFIKNKPTIPDAPVQADWTQADSAALSFIKHKPAAPVVLQGALYPDYNSDTALYEFRPHAGHTPTADDLQAIVAALESGVQVVFGVNTAFSETPQFTQVLACVDNKIERTNDALSAIHLCGYYYHVDTHTLYPVKLDITV